MFYLLIIIIPADKKTTAALTSGSGEYKNIMKMTTPFGGFGKNLRLNLYFCLSLIIDYKIRKSIINFMYFYLLKQFNDLTI